MNLVAEQSVLADAMKKVSRQTPARSQISQLPSLVRITVENDVLNLLTTDLDSATKCSIQVQSSNNGACIVSSRLLADIVSAMPPGAVEISLVDSMLFVKEKNMQFELRTMDIDEFPPIVFPTGDSIELPKNTFVNLARQILKASSKDDTRPILTSIHMKTLPDALQFTSTDSYRLSFARLSRVDTTSISDSEILIPSKVLTDVARLLSSAGTDSKDKDKLSINVSDTDINFIFDNIEVYSRLVSGKFPSFESVTSHTYKNKITINRTYLMESLKRVSILAKDNTSKVNISWSEIGIELFINSTTLGKAREQVEATYEGDESFSIGFNPNFIMDGIEVLDGDTIEISFDDSKYAALISSPDDDDFQYYLMPIRIKD